MRHLRGADGLSTLEIRLPVEDAVRFVAVLDLFIEHLATRGRDSAEDGEKASAEAPATATSDEFGTVRAGTAAAGAPAESNQRLAERSETPRIGRLGRHPRQ